MGPIAWIPAFLVALAPSQTKHLPNQAPVAKAPHKPNIVLILLDDVGVDLIDAYGESETPACTPNIDSLAAGGMLFRNAYSSPICSPSRAELLTGRHGFRTGIGNVVRPNGLEHGLPLTETTLPKLLVGYDSACSGKWHLAHPTDEGHGPDHPNNMGFEHYSGTLYNILNELEDGTYESWKRTTDGVQSVETAYATTYSINEAIYRTQTMSEPWFLYVPTNAVHVPRHLPPEDLIECPEGPTDPAAWAARSMLEATDTEIGRLLESIGPETWVILASDNGTGDVATLPPFNPAHAKGTLYEGGINVPLIIKGPGVTQGECQALVNLTDIFATVAELCGFESEAEDSVSLVPYLKGDMKPLRTTVYSERFSPNGSAVPHGDRRRAIRNERYKLIERTGLLDKFYDLEADPYEENDVMSKLSKEQQAAYNALKKAMPSQ